MVRKRGLLFVAVAAVGALGLSISGAGARSTVLKAGLSGEKEVSSTGEMGVGDPDGRGSATVRVNPATGRACFELSWRGIGAPSMAHVHEGDSETAGPIVVALFMTGDDSQPTDQDLPDTLSSVGGCVSEVDAALLRDIRDNPRGYYVNIHNDDYPPGAVRGQLHK